MRRCGDSPARNRNRNRTAGILPEPPPGFRIGAPNECSGRRDLMSDATSPYFSAEHEMLRATLRRFIEERVKPEADAWEAAGFVPRAVLREMGELGLLGIRYASRHGGSELDTLATVVLAEELGRSTYGGFAITVL